MHRISSQLYDTPILEGVNVVVNAEINVVICLSCETAITPGYLVSHLRKHDYAIPSVRRNEIEHELSKLRLPICLPPPPTQVIPALEGLPVYQAIYCPDCSSAFLADDSFKKHRRENHRHIRPPNPTTIGPAQQLNKSLSRTFFRVIVPALEVVDLKKPFHAMLQDIEAGQKALVPVTDVRNVSPWLRITKWHESFKGLDTDILRSMVEHPTNEEFPNLSDAVLFFFQKASDYIEDTTTLVLQKLNSPDPDKKYEVYHFLRHNLIILQWYK